MPQIRKPITTATDAAATLFAVVPNRSWTMLAVAPSSFMCVITRSANAFSSPLARFKMPMMTSAAGSTEIVMYPAAAAPELRLASK